VSGNSVLPLIVDFYKELYNTAKYRDFPWHCR